MAQSERKYSIEKINNYVKVKNGEFIFLTSDSCPMLDCVVIHSVDMALESSRLRYQQWCGELN
jgi:hypothetical protein